MKKCQNAHMANEAQENEDRNDGKKKEKGK